MTKKHPIQPLEDDGTGVVRFKPNKIVQYLLDEGGIDLNQIARKQFDREDEEQFAQLIGYSHSGFGSLSYASDETYNAAQRMYETSDTEAEARLAEAERMLAMLRQTLHEPMAALFSVHPDDLNNHK